MPSGSARPQNAPRVWYRPEAAEAAWQPGATSSVGVARKGEAGMDERVISHTAFWEHLTDEEKELVNRHLVEKSLQKGQLIASSDNSCMGIVFVLEGCIRVSILSEEGRQITLYRLQEGECCVTTASCVMKQITFDTVVTTTAQTRILVIPASVCRHLSDTSIYFRCFMLETETERFSQAIWVIQELLFKRFDQRLASYFVSEYEKSGNAELKLTQEEVAQDVNSAREVVARMLRHFSAEGLVEVKRGAVRLLDIQGLKNI